LIQGSTFSKVNVIASPRLNTSFKLNNQPTARLNETACKTTKSPTHKIEPSPKTTQPRPEHVPGTPWTCVVCNKELPDSERAKHFTGRPHQQTRGLLQAHVDETRPETKLLRVNARAWRCPPCEAQIPYPHSAGDLRGHLTSTKHEKALEKLWRNLKSLLGVRDNASPGIPRDFGSTFI
jgi:hypothetical protein